MNQNATILLSQKAIVAQRARVKNPVKDAEVSKATVKRATKMCPLLQNVLNSDVTRFTTHTQTCLATNKACYNLR